MFPETSSPVPSEDQRTGPTAEQAHFVPSLGHHFALSSIVLLQLVYVFSTQAALQLLLPYRVQPIPSQTGDPRLAADLDVVMGSSVVINGEERNNLGSLLGLGLFSLLTISIGCPILVGIAAWMADSDDPSWTYVLYPLVHTLKLHKRWWAAVDLMFAGLLLLSVGAASMISIAVSTQVFLLLVMGKLVLELLKRPYASKIVQGASTTSLLLVITTVVCMTINLLMDQQGESGDAMTGLAWFVAVLNFIAVTIGVLYMLRRPLGMVAGMCALHCNRCFEVDGQ